MPHEQDRPAGAVGSEPAHSYYSGARCSVSGPVTAATLVICQARRLFLESRVSAEAAGCRHRDRRPRRSAAVILARNASWWKSDACYPTSRGRLGGNWTVREVEPHDSMPVTCRSASVITVPFDWSK